MTWDTFMVGLMDNIGTPIITLIGVTLIGILTHFGQKITKSVIAKNEIADMEKKNTVRKDLLVTLGTIVDAAVASNMQLADAMKKDGSKLTEEQVIELNRSAKQLILNALPPSLTNDDGVLLEIIGGKEKLNAIIESFIERSVYEYKVRPKDAVIAQQTNEHTSFSSAFKSRRL